MVDPEAGTAEAYPENFSRGGGVFIVWNFFLREDRNAYVLISNIRGSDPQPPLDTVPEGHAPLMLNFQ